MFIAHKRFAPLAGALAIALFGTAVAPAVLAQDAAPAAEQPAEAAPPVDPAAVVATVNGVEVTEADLTFAAEDLSQELQQMPPEERRAFLLRVLIDMKVMAGAARDAGMADAPLFQQRLAYLEDRALRRDYFAETIAQKITPEAVQALYDEFVADFEPQEEIRARHILVETQEEANAVKAEIDGGADFATVAGEKSIDPGAANGGDLGFFRRGMMVGEFETAAFALTEVGQVSEPVQSQFGWHVIKLEERRESSPPSIDQVRPQLQQQVLMQAFDETVDELMNAATVEIPDPDLAAAVEAQQALEDEAAARAEAEAAGEAAPTEEAPAEAPAQ
jgi:peptidyl-prolyl cis-trans isomerase C